LLLPAVLIASTLAAAHAAAQDAGDSEIWSVGPVPAGVVVERRFALPDPQQSGGVKAIQLTRGLTFRHEFDAEQRPIATILQLHTLGSAGPFDERARIEFHGPAPVLARTVAGTVAQSVAGSERLVAVIDARDPQQTELAARLQAAAAQSGGRWHLWPIDASGKDGQADLRVLNDRLGARTLDTPVVTAHGRAVAGLQAVQQLAQMAEAEPDVAPAEWLAGRTPKRRWLWPAVAGAGTLAAVAVFGLRRRRDRSHAIR
jgi:hypothetical protein